MAITQYNLLLKAMLDPSSGDAIDQKIKEIQTRAQNQAVIKIKVIPEYGELIDPAGMAIPDTWGPTGNEIRQVTATYTDQMGKAVTETHRLSYEQGIYQQTLGNTATYTDKANLSTYNFARQLKNVALATLESMVTYQLVNKTMQSLGDSVQYVIDLNKELTNTQLVSGGSDEEIKRLAVSYNVLAREMGATTLEVAKGSLEFVRQGKSVADTAVLIKSSMMMSKLGNMESAESTDRLTSIMNGFKLTAEETLPVVDKLVALDNSFATSINEVSTAMKYGSNVAQQVGVDFDHLAAYIN